MTQHRKNKIFLGESVIRVPGRCCAEAIPIDVAGTVQAQIARLMSMAGEQM